jgi:hypothetical protein
MHEYRIDVITALLVRKLGSMAVSNETLWISAQNNLT